MKVPPVKGTRDFYPADMAVRNWLIDNWKKVSLRNGFAEYDGPIFEYLKMYQIKSGDEIAEQLFSLTDRGGRDLAIRPEITPTLARMVNQQINSLARPIKWFSVPRLCRAERPQKGRLREFFQWNIDVIGVDDSRADTEVIFTTIDYLRETGLTSKDIKVKISSRKLLSTVLRKLGVETDDLTPIYAILDKKAKLPLETFEKLLADQLDDKSLVRKILDFMSIDNVKDVEKIAGATQQLDDDIAAMNEVFCSLDQMGVADYCVFDAGIVRGLAYYTGVVFEAHDTKGQLRAICGGGRYDNLLQDFGGPKIAATGMGMGDCVLEVLLREKGLLSDDITSTKTDFFLACTDRLDKRTDMKIVAKLRSLGFSASFSYKTGNLSKQLKQASAMNAAKCIIIGDEFKDSQLVIKDMATGEQVNIDYDKFFEQLKPKTK